MKRQLLQLHKQVGWWGRRGGMRIISPSAFQNPSSTDGRGPESVACMAGPFQRASMVLHPCCYRNTKFLNSEDLAAIAKTTRNSQNTLTPIPVVIRPGCCDDLYHTWSTPYNIYGREWKKTRCDGEALQADELSVSSSYWRSAKVVKGVGYHDLIEDDAGRDQPCPRL